jgi:hypothetical protein
MGLVFSRNPARCDGGHSLKRTFSRALADMCLVVKINAKGTPHRPKGMLGGRRARSRYPTCTKGGTSVTSKDDRNALIRTLQESQDYYPRYIPGSAPAPTPPAREPDPDPRKQLGSFFMVWVLGAATGSTVTFVAVVLIR